MSRLEKVQSAVALFLVTTAVVLTYEMQKHLPDTTWAPRLLALAALATLPLLANWICRFAFGFLVVRRRILKELWIEGYWALFDFDGETLINNGVGQLRIADDGKMTMHVYRHKGIRTNHETNTVSDAILIGEGGNYANLFSGRGAQERVAGVATGKFIANSETGIPDRFDGQLFFFDGSKNLRQIGWRLSAQEHVAPFRKKFPENWGYYLSMHLLNCLNRGQFHWIAPAFESSLEPPQTASEDRLTTAPSDG